MLKILRIVQTEKSFSLSRCVSAACVCVCVKSSALHNTISSKIENQQQQQQQQRLEQLQNVEMPLGQFCRFYNSTSASSSSSFDYPFYCFIVCVRAWEGNLWKTNERELKKKAILLLKFQKTTQVSYRLVQSIFFLFHFAKTHDDMSIKINA